MTPEETCEKLKPIMGDKAEKLHRLYLMENYRGRAELEEAINALRVKNLKEDEILLPPPFDTSGDYPLGDVIYNGRAMQAFGLLKDSLTRHMAIYGTTGSGKTNACFTLINNLANDGIPFIITDFKRNYRDLLSTGAGRCVKVYTVGKKASPFSFNPLIPPRGVDPQIYINKLIDVINHSHFVSYGVDHLLQTAIHQVYQECGIYSQPVKVPTFSDVLEKLKKLPVSGRESLWKASALRTLQDLTFGPVGQVFNTERSIDLESFLKDQVVLELDALPQTTKTFLVEALLLQIYLYRINYGMRDEKLCHMLVLEEAHHLLLRQHGQQETITDIFLREVRETGQGVCLLDQSPALISSTALSNTNTLVAMQLKHQDDIRQISKALLLKDTDCFGMLKVGEAIVKTQAPQPFLIRFPLYPIRKGVVTDEDIRRHMGVEVQDVIAASFSADSGLESLPQADSQENREVRLSDKLGEDEKLFLKDIAEHPLSGVTSRYKRLRFSVERGQEVKNSLVNRGFLKPVHIPIKTGRLLLLEPTAKAADALDSLGLKARANRSGGVVHEYWKMKAASYYRDKGFKVKYEVPVGGGKAVDLVIEKDGLKTAVEIETGKSDFVENLKKCRGTFQQVIILATSTQAERKIKDAIQKANLDHGSVKIVNTKGFQ